MTGWTRKRALGSLPATAILDRPVRQAGTDGRRLGRGTVGLASLAGGLVTWQAAAQVVPNPPTLLPAPSIVAARLWDLGVRGVLWPHIGATLTEATLGFALATVVGLVLGYAVAESRLLEQALAPYVAATQAVPIVAVAPLMVLWFGLDLVPKVLTCAVIVFFPILVNTVIGLRGVDQDLVAAAKSMGAGRWQLLRYVQAPLALRPLLGGLRLGVTLAMTGAVVGEFIAANAGLGYLLNLGRETYDTPLVFVALVVLAALAIAGYTFVAFLEKRFLDWE